MLSGTPFVGSLLNSDLDNELLWIYVTVRHQTAGKSSNTTEYREGTPVDIDGK